MSSIFGSSNQNTENRFSNLTVNIPQQQLSQQPAASAFSHQQQVNVPTLVGPGSAGQSLDSSSDGSKTSWFNNPRKRTIPQSIVKRAAKAGPSDNSNANGPTTTTSANGGGFDAMTFGNKKAATIFNPSKKPHEPKDALPNAILIDSNEAPPSKSLFDWQREDEFGSMLPENYDSRTSISSFGSKKQPGSSIAGNVFDKGATVDAPSKDSTGADKGNKPSPTPRSESAVIVFGYPESISNQIIIQFSKFGNILEDFEALRGKSGTNAATLRLRNKHADENGIRRKYPIFTGDGWIKLTYDSPSSALRALQENGVVYGGCLIGCVPYKKSAVEQLASCKIEQTDDVGSFNLPTNPTPSPTLNVGKGDSPGDMLNVDRHNGIFLNSQRIEMKDGKSLFLGGNRSSTHDNAFLKTLESRMHDQDKNQHSNGVLGKVNNWLFGWNDL
ncbi:LADA_0F00694g1_1 [Lachancea dasiensis]|uniref:LADA_0F00694g1_1 n=1 Tax=Lachancea dasiensis TaxID=1072105 RepID=A0A1G4JHQ8_9SACH|nr:LADA_0F00694g1_1 [Lachancea dasiensis]